MTPPRKPAVFTGVSPAPSAKKPAPATSKAASSIPNTSPKPPKTATPPGGGLAATTSNGKSKKSSPNHSATAGRAQGSRNGSNVSSLGPLPAVPWSSNGALGRLNAKLFPDSSPTFVRLNDHDGDYIPPPPDSRRTSTFDMSPAETPWDANDDMDLEMLTEVMDGGEIDEEVSFPSSLSLALQTPFHSSKLPSTSSHAHTPTA
jgi:pyrimidine and pyridine-specific 5'-nucleotidase